MNLLLLELPGGASGSWVVSEQDAIESASRYTTGDHVEQKAIVLGHVVADDVLGDIYMIPLTDILSDIAKELRAREVRLPKTAAEIDSLLQHSEVSRLAEEMTSAMRSMELSINKPEREAAQNPRTHAVRSGIKEGPHKIRRWICCKCGGENSFVTDLGCVYCNDHWRDDRCEIYDVHMDGK